MTRSIANSSRAVNSKSRLLPLPDHVLEVRPSTIASAGEGLFTTIDIPAGVRVLEYTGVWKAAVADCVSHNAHEYCFEFNLRHCIDASCKRRGGKGRYVNDTHGTKRKLNLIWTKSRRLRKVFMTSSRKIKRGSELFVNYGVDYWDARTGVPLRRKKLHPPASR